MSTTAPDALATQAAPVDHDWAANPKIRWYRSPLPIAELRALSQRRTLRPLLHCLGFLALLTVTGTAVVLVHRHLSWPWLIPALFVHGTLFRTLQHSRHELSHRTVFRSRVVNEVFLRLFSFLHWSSPRPLPRQPRAPPPVQPCTTTSIRRCGCRARYGRCSGPAASCSRCPAWSGRSGRCCDGAWAGWPTIRGSSAASPTAPRGRATPPSARRCSAGRASCWPGMCCWRSVFVATGQWDAATGGDLRPLAGAVAELPVH